MTPISLCVCMCILSSKGSVKRYRGNEYARKNGRIVGRIVFFAVRVVSKESLWVCVCIPLKLLGNGSVKTFPRQRRIVGGAVCYVVHFLSKGSKRLVLLRISYFLKVKFSPDFVLASVSVTVNEFSLSFRHCIIRAVVT
jgi:hypothetical protein